MAATTATAATPAALRQPRSVEPATKSYRKPSPKAATVAAPRRTPTKRLVSTQCKMLHMFGIWTGFTSILWRAPNMQDVYFLSLILDQKRDYQDSQGNVEMPNFTILQ